MGLLHAADGRLGDSHPAGELDLGQFGGLAEDRKPHSVSAVGLGHVGADLGDFGGDLGAGGQPLTRPLPQMNLTSSLIGASLLPQPGINHRLAARCRARVENVLDRSWPNPTRAITTSSSLGN